MSQLRLTSTKTSRRSNVSRPLEGLKCELDLMAQENELLQKERDRYKAKVEAQARELQDSRRNIICGRCRDTSVPQITASAQLQTPKKASSVSSKPVPRSNPPSVSGKQRTTHRSTQRTTPVQESHSAATPSECNTMTQASNTIVAHSQSISLLSLSEPYLSTVDPDSSKEHNQSIIFNNKVEKELDVEMVSALFHGDSIQFVKFSRDGKYLAAGCRDGQAYIYDVERGNLTCILRNLLADRDNTKAVCFSHDGKHLATASSDRNIYIWEIKTKYVRNAFKGHFQTINSLDFSPNGRLLVSASHDNTVRLWNMRYGAKVLTNGRPNIYRFLSAVFSPDGMYVAASSGDGMVRIWDSRVGQLIRKLKSHLDWVDDVAFMPDGKGLMSASYDLRVMHWDIGSLYPTRFHARSQTMGNTRRGVEEQTQPEREFLGHTASVYSLSISPDGRWVASGSRDHSVRIWDTRNAEMQCILNHADKVYTVDFSPSGRLLASGNRSGVKIWRYSLVH